MDLFEKQRLNMIEGQLEPGGITDRRILNALMSVPKEMFVPAAYKESAYVDGIIKISDHAQFIGNLELARMLTQAEIKPTDKVMCIVSANGYYGAVVSKLAKKVVVVEEHREVTDSARNNLRELKIDNVDVVISPRYNGHEAYAPYDKIIIFGCVDYVPQIVLDQLSQDGLLIAGMDVGDYRTSNIKLAKILKYRNLGGEFSKTLGEDISLPLIQEFKNHEEFKFA